MSVTIGGTTYDTVVIGGTTYYEDGYGNLLPAGGTPPVPPVITVAEPVIVIKDGSSSAGSSGGGSPPAPLIPIPNFTYVEYAHRTIAFINTSRNSMNYFWDFGDGTTSAVTDPVHVYGSSGTYTVRLRAIRATAGLQYVESTKTITVSDLSEYALFASVSYGLTAYFRDLSTKYNAGHSWNFGDGSTSTEKNPRHNYAANGTYTVTLMVGSLVYSSNVVVSTETLLTYESEIGSTSGSANGQFNLPYDVAVNATHLFVTDSFNSRVQIFYISDNSFFGKFGSFGGANGQFSANMRGIEVDASYIYANDTSNGMQWFDMASPFAYVSKKTGVSFVGIDMDDTKVYTTANESSEFKIWDKAGMTLEYTSPSDLTFRRSLVVYGGYIYVTTNSPAAIEVYNKVTHALVATYTDASLSAPFGIDADATFLYITDTGNHKVHRMLRADGTYIDSIGGVGVFNGPRGVVVDSTRVYVADTLNHKVKIYSKPVPRVTPPTADFSSNVTSGDAPLTVNFTDTSDGTGLSWAWDFSDGGTDTVQNPSHTFTAPGVYPVRLTISNSFGTSSIDKIIFVKAAAINIAMPAASFTASQYSGPAPVTINFTDTSGGAPSAWSWKENGIEFSTAQNPSRLFSSYGTYVVTLTITRDAWTSTCQRTILITADSNIAPIVNSMTADISAGEAPLGVQFGATAVGAVTTWAWDFGNGETSSVQNPQHTFHAPGSYLVTLTVTNAYGSSTASMTIIVVASVIVDGGGNSYLNGHRIGWYIVDTEQHRVLVYTNAGEFITQFGGFGTGNGKFNAPTSVAVLGGVQLLDRGTL